MPAAAEGELTDRALDMESDPRHLFELIDIRDPDRASAKPHPGRHEVKRLGENAGILENQRIGNRAVLPRNPAKARGNRDQDLGRRAVTPIADAPAASSALTSFAGTSIGTSAWAPAS